MRISECDLIFLSFGEPNAEKHFALLQEIAPWVKRVDGVKGFNSAHVAAADVSDTQHFVTIDADNIVLPEFFDLKIEDVNGCISWQGLNMLNGLQYGNGGPKLWNKDFIYNMKCHEASEDGQSVDFCWIPGYNHKDGVYTQVWCNGSPEQAFRAGFREGVKLSLDRGKRLSGHDIERLGHPANIRALKMWMSLGRDRAFGEYALAGARHGLISVANQDFDITVIRDYDRFNKEISEPFFYDTEHAHIPSHIEQLAVDIFDKTGIVVPEFNEKQSLYIRDLIL